MFILVTMHGHRNQVGQTSSLSVWICVECALVQLVGWESLFTISKRYAKSLFMYVHNINTWPKRVFTYYVAQTKPYTYILNSMPVMTFIQNPILLIIIWSQTILFHSCLWWPSAVTVLVCTPNINLHIITIAFVKVAQDRYYWLIT